MLTLTLLSPLGLASFARSRSELRDKNVSELSLGSFLDDT
jgi:hypothetical protein